MSVLIYPVAMFDFKNFKIFDNFYLDSNNEAIILTCFFVLPAFFLNLFFNFLTKKFPKPFEKIGYWCSLEFFKGLIKNRWLHKNADDFLNKAGKHEMEAGNLKPYFSIHDIIIPKDKIEEILK